MSHTSSPLATTPKSGIKTFTVSFKTYHAILAQSARSGLPSTHKFTDLGPGYSLSCTQCAQRIDGDFILITLGQARVAGRARHSFSGVRSYGILDTELTPASVMRYLGAWAQLTATATV